ncbi:hypothetical protein SEA_MEDIUMFRY_80 [Arthrobacter phage MediumFry]|nr:hypothetical protein SEA_CATERPILLAR_81 [Arthrobacter phage Caterpillar]AXH44624.1 hypothetical protein SEA_MEDIUMFRY_80 [Arthrobacter phage MediumFry]
MNYSDKWDRIWAAWWAICCGHGWVRYIFNQENEPWTWVGALIYTLLFAASVYQIKAQRSVWAWIWERHKKRKAWKADPNNWSV